MPDLAVPPPIGLYPQPSQGGGANPTQALGLFESLTRNQLLMQELKAKNAIGQVYQESLNPDLTLNPEKARDALQKYPEALFGGQAPQQLQNVIGTQTQNSNQFKQILSTVFGALGDNPSNESVNAAAATARRLGVPTNLVLPIQDSLINSRNRPQTQGMIRNLGLSPAEQSNRQELVGPGGARGTIPTTSANIAGVLPTGLGLTAQASANRLVEDQGVASKFNERMTPWTEALRAVNDFQAKGGNFGPGAEARQDVAGLIQSLSPTLGAALGIDPKKLADFAGAKKYLTQTLQNRAGSLGVHSDQGLSTTVSGSPNVHVTDFALPDLIKTGIAVNRAEQAQIQEASKAGPENYAAAKADWTKKNDIRAFKIDLMEPAERAKFLKSLTPAERARVNNSLRSADEAGIIDMPAAAKR